MNGIFHRRAFALWLMLASGVATPATAMDWKTLVDRAEVRSAAARALPARRVEQEARGAEAEALLPAGPALRLENRDDRWRDDLGSQEWKLGISLPLWLPGESASKRALADAGTVAVDADARMIRLQVAGRVRDLAWRLALARQARAAAAERLDAARRLAEDVAKRVAAGEIAEADRLLAVAEVDAAETELASLEGEAASAEAVYAGLVGSADLPDPLAEAPAKEAAGHPLRESLEAEAKLARARRDVAAKMDRERPELFFYARDERADSASLWGRSIGWEISLPLASSAVNRARLAEAQAGMAAAEEKSLEAARELAATKTAAQAGVDASRRALAAATRRLERLNTALVLKERAFAAGELPLFDLLMLRRDQAGAAAQAARLELEAGRSVSVLNQAFGNIP